ncbi:N-6 DNA methylase, partial [Phytoactinopolyspora endophytica]|uniref:N-6 DNA methylase n=1 Tax=Phytoactinopolyspora endophytica TaxID=1642495 RepID=UPI00197BF9D3
MNRFEGHLSLSDLARLAEVSVAAVSNWRSRHSDFPSARQLAGQEVFIVGEVARWLHGRKIPKNRLKASEARGVTYGERFLRNLGFPESAAPTAATTAKIRQVPGKGRRFEPVMYLLRGGYDAASAVELTLGMLYLRVREPALWRQLTNETQRGAVHELLARAELPPSRSAPSVPLFRAVAGTTLVDHSLIEAIHAMNEVDLGSAPDTTAVVAQLCDSLLAQVEHDAGRQGEHLTPESLVRCMVGLIDPTSRDRIYDPFCGSGELLAAATTHAERGGGDGSQVSGQAFSESSWLRTKLNMALHGAEVDLGAHPSNALRDNVFAKQQFDVVLANPPFNMRSWTPPNGPFDQDWPYGTPPSRNANFAWLQHVASKLEPDGGRAAVLMPNTVTTVQNGTESEIRARMVDAGVIDCVVALPDRLFRSTGIPVSLWLLRSVRDRVVPEVLFIDATGMGSMADRVQRVLADEDIGRIIGAFSAWQDRPSGEYDEQPWFARSVSYAEIRESEYVLNPRVYVHPVAVEEPPERSMNQINKVHADLNDLRTRALEIREVLDAKLADISVAPQPDEGLREGEAVISLGTACDLLAGPGAVDRGRDQPSWTPVILPRNIKQNRIVDDELDAVDPSTAVKLRRYRLAPGDIVCTRTGTLGRFGLVHTGQAGWLLGPGCMRLRPTEGVDPRYLTYYLGTPHANAWLMNHATGSAVQHINTKTLSRMPITLP